PARGPARLHVGGREPDRDRHLLRVADRLRRRDRIRVGAHHLGGDLGPREAAHVGGRGERHRDTPFGLVVEISQRLGQRLRIGGGAHHPRGARAGGRRVGGGGGGDA